MPSSLFQRYGSAGLALLLATLLRLSLDPILGDRALFLTYFGAVMFVAWYAGRGPALVTLVGSALLAGYLFVSPRGSLFWFTDATHRVTIGLYVIIGFFLITLTELMRTNRAQAEAGERHLRQLLESSSVGVLMGDAEGRIHYANPALLKVLGYSAEEVAAGQVRWDRITPPEYAEQDARAVREFQASGHWAPYEKEYLAKDGRRVPILIGGARLEGIKDSPSLAAAFVTDLTPFRQAEQALTRHQAQFEALFSSTTDAVILTDPQRHIVQVNPAFTALFGYAPQEAIGQTTEFLYADKRAYQELGRRRYHTDATFGACPYELQYRRKDGTHFWAESVGNPIKDLTGTHIGFLGIHRDITARRRAELALRESEEKYHLLWENLNDAAFIADTETGALIETNKQGELLVGRSRDEILRLHQSELHPTGKSDEYRARFAAHAAQGHAADYDGEVIRKDGRTVSVHISATSLMLGDKQLMLGLFHDITERKVAEQALRASEKKYRDLINNLYEGIWLIDQDHNTTFVNARLADMLGYRTEEMLGKHLFAFMDKRGAALATRNLERGRKGVRADYEFEFRRKDGTPIVTRIATAPIFDDEGNYRGALAGVVDITERKAAETALQQSELKLRVQAAQLAEADRHKDEFLATLAHELRNPLAPISNALQLLKRGGTDPALMGQALGMAERQVGQLVRLVDDLLDISRITRGKITLHKERVALDAVIRSALETARPPIAAAGHRLTVELPEAPVYLEADLTRLAQAVSNLLINAAKFTAPGGQIQLRARCEGDEVAIAVQDSGIGIPAAQLPKLFGLFAQLEQPPGQRREGLGIGLALVKSLVELHGGRVAAASAGPGHGSTFTIRLPRSPAAPARAAAESVPATERPAALQPRRLLVVDDQADVADSMALLLKACGHEVVTAYDGAAALAAARTHRPEVVLLDLGMPGLDGYEVARRLRELPELHGTRIIALTGWGQEEDRRRSQGAGFDAHLVKPVDLPTLEALLDDERPAAGT